MFTGLQELHWLALPIAIFLARICDVSAGTIRIICVTRGFRTAAVVLAFIEILVWVIALSAVFTHLNRIENVIAYAGGFATGNAVGIWLEQKLALGTQLICLVSKGRAHAVAQRLRFADYIVTTLNGDGRDSPVALCLMVVPRRKVTCVIRIAKEIDPEVLAIVTDVRERSQPLLSNQWAGKIPLGTTLSKPPVTRTVATPALLHTGAA